MQWEGQLLNPEHRCLLRVGCSQAALGCLDPFECQRRIDLRHSVSGGQQWREVGAHVAMRCEQRSRLAMAMAVCVRARRHRDCVDMAMARLRSTGATQRIAGRRCTC